MKKLLLATIAIAAIPAAFAVKIDGSIAFDGSTSLDAPVPSATSFDSFSNAKVSQGTQTGDYLGTGLTPVTFMPLDFTTPTFGELWKFSIGSVDYSFVVNSIATVSRTALTGSLYQLAVSGTGTAMISGYEDTMGQFSLTTTGNASQTDLGFAGFSFTTATVPDSSSTAALLGLGLIGLISIQRRFKSKTA
ncbi:VPDSG-CTERM sorting domain-containing protein [Pelagicoccus sp. SDUM812005]|uniref:VPDSG-CTERM sorting domain-containing protein n=1 Tax=Pelagicoccus sp. SDUM812005 TaxID=3041257 RepID=UPI00280CCF86|nr:VPDSG-CTERM sorting domain-containing protein [Pelagicoccus sp. SDUM812005]MDQ8181067.1 VPDSG-CTERM sorting domain-containing protein [Pelagicoccus sp. SDUM812005]